MSTLNSLAPSPSKVWILSTRDRALQVASPSPYSIAHLPAAPRGLCSGLWPFPGESHTPGVLSPFLHPTSTFDLSADKTWMNKRLLMSSGAGSL